MLPVTACQLPGHPYLGEAGLWVPMLKEAPPPACEGPIHDPSPLSPLGCQKCFSAFQPLNYPLWYQCYFFWRSGLKAKEEEEGEEREEKEGGRGRGSRAGRGGQKGRRERKKREERRKEGRKEERRKQKVSETSFYLQRSVSQKEEVMVPGYLGQGDTRAVSKREDFYSILKSLRDIKKPSPLQQTHWPNC